MFCCSVLASGVSRVENLQEWSVTSFTPFNGNSCKSQLYFVKFFWNIAFVSSKTVNKTQLAWQKCCTVSRAAKNLTMLRFQYDVMKLMKTLLRIYAPQDVIYGLTWPVYFNWKCEKWRQFNPPPQFNENTQLIERIPGHSEILNPQLAWEFLGDEPFSEIFCLYPLL